MRRSARVAVVAALAIAVAALGWRWYAGKATPPGKTAPAAATEAAALEFAAAELAEVAPADLARTLPVTGTVRAVTQTIVRAKVAGELRELAVREGMTVRAGERLARIDPTDFEARVREREAQLRSAEAQLEQAQRTHDNNRQLLERNFISQNAFDNARSALDVAVAARDAAVAQLAQARKALADTAVTAPIAGTVGERFAQVGEKLSPDNRILSLVDLGRLEVEAPVPAADLGSVRLGEPITVRVEGVDTPLAGRIVRISPATAPGTRSVPVWIGIDNPQARARVGMFARAALTIERRDGVLAIPAAAVREQGGRRFVYAVVDGRLVERDVVTGLRDEGDDAAGPRLEVRSGLRPGERIVAVNLGPLRAGAPVVVRGERARGG